MGNNSKKNKINGGGGGRNAAFMQNIWHFGKGNAMCFEFHSQMVCVKPFKKKKQPSVVMSRMSLHCLSKEQCAVSVPQPN